MNEHNLPMPTTTHGGRTVVASCWLNDDEDYGPVTYALLTFAAGEEFYAVEEWEIVAGGAPVKIYGCSYPNIIPAAEGFSELIGGY
jgi:hypothetical protein